jgi:hypothetical protein
MKHIINWISFKNLQFGAGRTMIKNVVLFYFILNIILKKTALCVGCVGYKLKKALN